MRIESLIENSNLAIRHYEDTEAKKLLKQLEQFVFSNNIQQTDIQLYQKLQKIIIGLKIVAIPHLSDEEVAAVLRNNYLDSFDIEIDMENRLTIRLFYVPEIPRDEFRKKLKKALLENQQKLGPLTVSQWLYEFEKTYPVQTRRLDAPVDFVITNRDALMLDNISKNRLKELLHTYDYLLVQTLPATGPALMEIINSVFPNENNYQTFASDMTLPPVDTSDNYQQPTQSQSTSQPVTVKIDIYDALQKYPETLEQLITSQPIKIKAFPEPVRPSLKNWLSDYTYNLGYNAHSSIVRGNYMFQNENTKTMSFEDRQKLGYILKSYDEKTPVTVDTARKQIVFPAMDRQEARSKNPYLPAGRQEASSHLKIQNPPVSKPVYNFDHMQSASQPARPPENNLEQNYEHYRVPQKPAFSSAPPVQSENLKFSSPQKMPFEREKEEEREQKNNFYQHHSQAIPPAAPARIEPPKPPVPSIPERQQEPAGPKPLYIHPVSQDNENGEEEKEELPRNVVNLRE
jgi:hypothetical protein